MGLTTTAAGTQSYRAFCATIDTEETKETNIFTTHVIPDDEDDKSFQPSDPVAPPAPEEEPVASPEQKSRRTCPGTHDHPCGPRPHPASDLRGS